jgi:hypothetical protein
MPAFYAARIVRRTTGTSTNTAANHDAVGNQGNAAATAGTRSPCAATSAMRAIVATTITEGPTGRRPPLNC